MLEFGPRTRRVGSARASSRSTRGPVGGLGGPGPTILGPALYRRQASGWAVGGLVVDFGVPHESLQIDQGCDLTGLGRC